MTAWRWSITVVFVAAFFSCGVIPRAKNGAITDASEPRAEDYDGQRKVYYYFSEGLKAASVSNDKVSAEKYFQKAISTDSSFDASYFALADLLFPTEPARALEYSRRAFALDTTNLTYKSQMAQGYIATGQYDDALDVYVELLREDPHNAVNYSLLAALYDYKKQPFTAISILDSAEYKLGRIEQLSEYKRQLLINVRMYDSAISETKAMIAAYPYDDENYRILGDLYEHSRKDSLALEAYGEALRIDSTNINSLYSLSEFHKKRGNERSYLAVVKRIFESDAIPVDDKIRLFEEATISTDYYRRNYFSINTLASVLLVKHPQEYSVLDLYATHLLRAGETNTAADLYKSYIVANPDSLAPYNIVIDIESYLQRPDSVAKYFDLALKRFPKDPELYLRKGFSMDHMNRRQQALQAYGKALKYSVGDSMKSVVLGVTGDAYYKSGNHKMSFRQYKKSLRLNPDNATVLNNYAYFLSELDMSLEKALEMSQKANGLTPGNATFLDTQAWVLYKLGRYEEAKPVMFQAISLDRRGSEVLLLHYGDILYELGDYFMAEVYWKRALDKGSDEQEIEDRLARLEK